MIVSACARLFATVLIGASDSRRSSRLKGDVGNNDTLIRYAAEALAQTNRKVETALNFKRATGIMDDLAVSGAELSTIAFSGIMTPNRRGLLIQRAGKIIGAIGISEGPALKTILRCARISLGFGPSHGRPRLQTQLPEYQHGAH